MASRTRIGRKNRVFNTFYEPPSEISLSKGTCKGLLSQTTPQATISSSLSQSSNVQVPTPLPQPLQVPASVSQSQPQLNSSQATTLTHETILNSNDSHSLKRKGRGPTRGKGTDDIVSAAGKISLEISKNLGRAIGNQQARLASECGYVVRSFAPLCYKRWIDIPSEEKNKLYDRVLAKFKLDLTVEHVHKCVNDTLARRYRDYRCRLKEKYFNEKTLDDAIKNYPANIKQVDWDWLCQYWSTPEFQRSITKDNAQGEIDLYYETHYSEKKGWVNDEARTRYERMLQIKEQPVLEGSEAPTELEIMQEVLGKSRGYIRGLGHGPKPASSHSVHLTSVDTESIAPREKIQKQEQELLDMRSRLSQFETLMHKFVSSQVSMSLQQSEPTTLFSMPPPAHNI